VTARRVWKRLLAEIRCSGLAAWRALMRMLNGDDLTHAAAIAFYAPFGQTVWFRLHPRPLHLVRNRFRHAVPR
jgi:hypothetical protein